MLHERDVRHQLRFALMLIPARFVTHRPRDHGRCHSGANVITLHGRRGGCDVAKDDV